MEGNPDVRTPNYDIMILLNHNLVDFLCIHSYTRLGARQTNDYIWNLKGLLNHYEPDKNGRLNKLHNSRWMTKNTRFAEGQQKAAPFWGNFASVTAEVMQWNSLLTSHKCWNKTLTVSVFLHHCTFQVRSFQIGCHLIVLIIQRGLVSTSEWPRSTTGPLPECSSPACLQLTTGLTHHSTPLAWTRFSSLVPAHHGVSGWGPPYIQTPRLFHYAPLATPSLHSRTTPPAQHNPGWNSTLSSSCSNCTMAHIAKGKNNTKMICLYMEYSGDLSVWISNNDPE